MHPRFLLCLTFITAARLAGDDGGADSDANQAPIAMSPVVVTTTLDRAREDIVPSLGASNFQISKMQIDAAALGPSGAFNQVLLRAPGVAQDSFGQVHLRGEHGDLQYRVNDVLLPEGISGFGQELDTRFVESVALLTGSLPAQYGYRTAGVVDIHTRSGTAAAAGDAALYGGSFDSLRASAEATGSLDGVSSYLTASAYASAIGIENPTAGDRPLHDHTRQLKTFGYFSDVLDSTRRLSLMVSSAESQFQIPDVPGQSPVFALAGGTTPDSARLDENQREDNDYAILAYQQTSDGFSAQIAAFARYSLVHFLPDRAGDLMYNGVASDVRRDLAGGGFEADLKWSVAPTHTVRGGIVVTDTNVASRTTTTVFPVDASGAQSSTTPFAIPADQRKLGWLTGAYLQDEWKPASNLTINYGVRADRSQALIIESQLSPRLNLVDQISNTTSLHAGYARYFTPPALELLQTPDLQPFLGTTNAPATTVSSPVRSERAHYFDAGLSHQFSSALSATLDGYLKRAINQLDEGQFGRALIFSPFNYAHGRIAGAELSANYTRGGFAAFANVAVSRATGRDVVSGEFQFDPAELAYIATHDVHLDHDQTETASVGSSYRVAGMLVYADLLYGSGLRRGFANTGHLPAYHPLNVGVERTFKLGGTRELIARLDIVNLLDEVYELRDGSGIGVGAPQFGQRRGLYGGLTLAF